MAQNVRRFDCPPEAVFEVLADGWLYPSWVVGASRMRAVDADWPHAGSRLHHSFGVWPAVIDDETSVQEWVPPRRMQMRPSGWPLGEARVVLEVKPRGTGCVVRIDEVPVAGPGRWVPRFLMDAVVRVRNRETLRRLAHLAEGRYRASRA